MAILVMEVLDWATVYFFPSLSFSYCPSFYYCILLLLSQESLFIGHNDFCEPGQEAVQGNEKAAGAGLGDLGEKSVGRTTAGSTAIIGGINVEHLSNALKDTRPSVSSAELQKYSAM
jgi:hypothetical protein